MNFKLLHFTAFTTNVMRLIALADMFKRNILLTHALNPKCFADTRN